MRKQEYDFWEKVKKSFLISIIVIGGLFMILFFYIYNNNNKEQQMYSLRQNYEQNYANLQMTVDRINGLAKQLSAGYALEKQQVFRKESASDEKQKFEELTEYTDSMEFAMQDINIHYYIDDDFTMVHKNGLHYRPIGCIREKSWYRKLVENNGKSVWFSYQADEYNPGIISLALARNITNQDDYTDSIGILVIFQQADGLKSSLVEIAEEQCIFIEDAQGKILACNDYELLENYSFVREYEEMIMNEYMVFPYQGEKYLLKRNEVKNTGIYLVSVVPYQYVSNVTKNTARVVILCYFAIMIIFYYYIVYMSKRLTTPLTQLTKLISESTREEKLHQLEVESQVNEIKMLVEAYNTLIEKIDYLLKQQYQLGEDKKQAELMALQSQINPHFLYNTLDMVNWMAEKNEKENVQLVIQKMSEFYRLALSKGKNEITIGEEIKLCETYLAIQQMRFRGRINYSKDVEDSILSYAIPKITLQPFVENAIIHGINVSPEGRGNITIYGWCEEDRIILAVTDDGVGMSQEESVWDNKKKGSHYGMKNIQKRLSVFYKEEIKLEIESTLGIGTCISINIPERLLGKEEE